MRSTQYDSQIILNRSYKLFNKGGLNNLKIRAVAHACHCSVMPIYYSFKSQQGLHHAVLKKAFDSFEKNLIKETKSQHNSYSRHNPYWYFYTVLSNHPGLVSEITSNDKSVITSLAIISHKYFPNTSIFALQASLLLVCSAINIRNANNPNLPVSTFSKVTEGLLRNLEMTTISM